jgi:DNA-binding response OmpR family regulator
MKILVVEDNVKLNETIKIYLTENNFSVDVAFNGVQALSKVKDLKKKNETVLKLQLDALEISMEKLKMFKISIFDIQNSKIKLIQTMTDIINIETALNQNAISINYIQGEHND